MAFFARPQPTAVRISHPTTADDSGPSPRKDPVQRQCRNIVIYGHCKYQDKGCQYHHPQDTTSVQTPDIPSTPTSLSVHAINAPVFVPKSSVITTPKSPDLSADTPTTSPPPTSPPYDPAYDPFAYTAADAAAVDQLTSGLDQMEMDSSFYADGQYSYAPAYNDGLDSFYTHPAPFLRQPLNYLLYTPSLPEEYVQSTADSHFIPPSSQLRQLLQTRSETIRTVAPPDLNLPDECQGYHSFVPLEQFSFGTTSERRKLGNWYSTVYRAIRASDGRPYTLRRVENYRLMHQSAFAAIELWSSIRHPSIVPVREAFTTKSFNDNSLVVCYAYYPGAQTLFDAHFKKTPSSSNGQSGGRQSSTASQQQQQQQQNMIPERTLWSYIVQLASAIKRVHETGNPVRMVDPTKILITGQNRIHIGSCGIIDVLMHGSPPIDPTILIQEDLTMFGRLVFSLACSNVNAWTAPQFQKSLDWMARTYSPDVKSVALYLISKPSAHKSIDHLLEMIRPRVLAEMEDALLATDRLEQELTSEHENARLVRLLCKFGFINERPEFALEPRWSETGDRYIIKLFRDYVFHQVDEHGNPVVNMSHVLTCLNKLDAGSEERIMLVSRDDTSCLVVSYKEIRACLEGAFSDLARPSAKTAVPFQPAR